MQMGAPGIQGRAPLLHAPGTDRVAMDQFRQRPRLRADPVDTAGWWTVLKDAKLDGLVHVAYIQNLTLRAAG